MFLIMWNRPCSVGIGNVKLGPGINEVDSVKWERLLEIGYKRQIKEYITAGDVEVHDLEKPTQQVVAKTYNMDLLETWLDEAKGPLKGTIRKRIKELKAEWELRDKQGQKKVI